MQTIASFEVDHTVLKEGIYLSRIDHDVITYDLRFVVPNGGNYLPSAAMHTIEHLFAVHSRNGAQGDHIIYFGPMGCRTGFYLLTTGLSHTEAIDLVKECVLFIRDYSGDVPGCSAKECGNYLEHDLAGARAFCADYYEKIKDWSEKRLQYK